MRDLANRRRGPFVVLAALFVAVFIIVIAIPDSFLSLIARNTPLAGSQTGWAYRLLVFFALSQILYTSATVYRVDRIEKLREKDERFARLTKPQVVSSLARNAAALVFFTLVYGLASIFLTGQRGGFWLFPVMAIAQAAWYYREIGQIAAWDAFQPATSDVDPDRGAWSGGGPPDYIPPLTRGLSKATDIAPLTYESRDQKLRP
ncbi:MAG: hypothetical protein QOG16_167 [Actinomycetota bacterium]|nr:hypothetical protein [Actinomycetota bacterium]